MDFTNSPKQKKYKVPIDEGLRELRGCAVKMELRKQNDQGDLGNHLDNAKGNQVSIVMNHTVPVAGPEEHDQEMHETNMALIAGSHTLPSIQNSRGSFPNFQLDQKKEGPLSILSQSSRTPGKMIANLFNPNMTIVDDNRGRNQILQMVPNQMRTLDHTLPELLPRQLNMKGNGSPAVALLMDVRPTVTGRAQEGMSSKSRTAESQQARSNALHGTISSAVPSSRGGGSTKRKSAESMKRSNLAQRHLQQNEVRALRLANPHSQLFEKHLSKVILSVQNRKRAQLMHQRGEGDSRGPMALGGPNFEQSLQSTISNNQGLQVPGLNLSAGLFKQTQLSSQMDDSPKKSVDQQLLQISEEEHREKGRNMVPVTAAIKGLIPNSVIPKAVNPTKQVDVLLHKIQMDKDKVFIPLEIDPDPKTPGLIFKEAKNQRKAQPGQIVFTKAGFIRVAKDKNDVSDFVSKEDFIKKGTLNNMLGQIPFFKKFHKMKVFKRWRNSMRQNCFTRTRQQLAQNFIFSKPIFASRYQKLIQNHNEVRFLKFLEIKQNMNYGKHQQVTLEDRFQMASGRSTKALEAHIKMQHNILRDLKAEITDEDKKFAKERNDMEMKKLVKQTGHTEALVMFSAEKVQLGLEQQKRMLLHLRHYQFNRLVQFMARYLCDMLVEVLHENLAEFKSVFCNIRSGTQFEVSLCFNADGKLDTDPTIVDHRNIFVNVFEQCEEVVLKNQLLQSYMSDMGSLMFTDVNQNHPFFKVLQATPSHLVRQPMGDDKSRGGTTALNNRSAMDSRHSAVTDSRRLHKQSNDIQGVSGNLQVSRMGHNNLTSLMNVAPPAVALSGEQQSHKESQKATGQSVILLRRLLVHMEKTLGFKQDYKDFKLAIFTQLDNDIAQVKMKIHDWKEVEEVAAFTQEWHEQQQNKNNSVETSDFKKTWDKISQFKKQIDENLPASYQKLGTIMLETLTLRNQLQEMPRKVEESIREQVTDSMKSETKLLREELVRTKDVLEPTPHTLNVYVEQVNTLKYIEQKKEEYKQKNDTINKLYKQCKDDNIRVAPSLQFNIQEVNEFYENLPTWEATTKNNLKSNRETMETIMKGSSNSLSKKIKSFEKRYLENYLKDKQRLEDCAETLEELFKRSKAIHEIRSKVTLYKEFLKLLYEDDAVKLENNPLSCTKDYNQLQEVHNMTLKLWKILAYWKKRKTMCYTTPFIELDLQKVIKSIEKVQTFFDKRLPKNVFVAKHARPLTEATVKQVQECSLIVDFAKDLKRTKLYQRHWEQIFQLIKAQHLKNSTSFTLVDLSEHNIRNYGDDVGLIIDHAKTERQYEEVFLSIKEEWEKSKLKIIPFKDSLKDYVLVNTEIMQSAIEENLGTLENLQKSEYATHVSSEIGQLVVKLRRMLNHLDLWIQAQKHWVTLDPVFNSNLFDNFFGDNMTEFLEVRSQYRRIMWSSFRYQKATYNLMIDGRLPTFTKLTHYYSQLQKRVHEYLEEKRLVFTRFFFLNDSQFLDFLMLAHSNHDFSVYVNLLFQGAQKLFINRIQTEQLPAAQDQMAIMGGESQESDFEMRLEQFLQQAKQHIEPLDGDQDFTEDKLVVPQDTEIFQRSLDHVFAIGEQPSFLPKIGKETNRPSTRGGNDSELAISEQSDDVDSLDGGRSGSSLSMMSDEEPGKTKSIIKKLYKGTGNNRSNVDNMLEGDGSIMSSTNENFQQGPPKTFQLKDFSVLGLVSQNKELFLFDRHIPMAGGIETWLAQVEHAMQATNRKLMKSAVEKFVSEPIEEWALDYPQQISISVLLLILSHEITEILNSNTYESEGAAQSNKQSDASIAEQNKSMDQHLSGIPGEVPIQIGDEIDDPLRIIENSVPGKKAGRTRDKKKDNEKEDTKISVYQHQVIRESENRAKPRIDPEEEEEEFMEDAFGAACEGDIHEYINSAKAKIAQEEQRSLNKDMQSSNNPIQAYQKKQAKTKKVGYKETVHQVLMHSGMQSLYVRITFWINKFIKMLTMPKQESFNLMARDIELTGVHKLQLKSMVLFLKTQQELVDNLILYKVTEAHDFEWESKLRINWRKTIQGEDDMAGPFTQEDAVTVCGGWTQLMGYEYLSTNSRLLITPLTQRYFLFMASTLRQKQQVMFQCCPEQQQSAEVFEEFASICAVPFRKFQCGSYMNLSQIMQILNGCAMARVWMHFEQMDQLPLLGLSTLIKEIQLIQQQYTVRDYQALQRKEDAKRLLFNKNDSELEGTPQAVASVGFGIFASISSRLKRQQPSICKNFAEQARSCFRIVNTVKPDLEAAMNNLLFVEGFSIHKKVSKIIMEVIAKFKETQQEKLYGKKPGEAPFDEGHMEQIDINDIRLAMKLACILRNQEYTAFYAQQISILKQQDDEILERRDTVVFRDKNDHLYKTKIKGIEDFMMEKQRSDASKQILCQEKHIIEIEAIKEGIRIVLKQRFLTEWQDNKRQSLIKNQVQEKTSRHSKKANTKPKDPTDQIDLNAVENSLDDAILSSFQFVIEGLRTAEENQVKAEEIRAVQAARQDAKVYDMMNRSGIQPIQPAAQAKGAEDKPKPSIKRTVLKKESLLEYQMVNTAITPNLAQSGTTALSKPGLDYSQKMAKHLIHATKIQLTHSKQRQRKEEAFQEQIIKGILKAADELELEVDEAQVYNCLGIIEHLRRKKSIILLGPLFTGKTQLMKLATLALRSAFDVSLRTSLINPITFTDSELYGPALALEQTSSMSMEDQATLQRKSVFQIILQNYERERKLMSSAERNKLIQSIFVDAQSCPFDLSEAFVSFMRESNLRERDYQKEVEFLLDFDKDAKNMKQGLVQQSAVKFPNGNLTMFPSDIYLFWECSSLADASPTFISLSGVVTSQQSDLTYKGIFQRQLKQTMRRHDQAFQDNFLPSEEITRCCEQFVLKFVEKLANNKSIAEWSLWNQKAQTLQFFVILNALLYRLFDNCQENLDNEDPMAFPIEESASHVLWNIVLVSTVWSYGAVLNGDLRKVFDEQFTVFQPKFLISFGTPVKVKYTLFDLYFDIEQLQWVIITEKLDYKIRVMFDKTIQTVLMPSAEISQACFIQDTLLYAMRKDGGDLNKHFRLIGPSGSQKSVILRHSIFKLKQPFKSIAVPMSSYLTLDKFKEKVEEKYEPKKKNNFVLRESGKPLLISIDDVHLQQNLKVEVLEFLRSWCICKGYFDVQGQIFKRIGDFGTMMAENSEFQATSSKKDRFLFYTTTLFCEEIDSDRFKPFVQYWLTSNAWETCDMVKRFYILITNALMSLVKTMKSNEQFFGISCLQKLHRFQFVAKFCSNLVQHSVLTDNKKVVFQADPDYDKRKEEEAMAEIFCYEAMRTFGDRIMRPEKRTQFIDRLADICHKEFRWDKKKYTSAFLEKLIMGNYHCKTPESHIQMVSITEEGQEEQAKEMIHKKISEQSGNQMLQLLMDAPTGLHDLYRMSRIIFKEQQHLCLVGQPGSSKQELMHLVGLVNETIVLELNAPCYGAPLEFAAAFRNALLTAVKLECTPVFILISDQQLRDPIYYDFIYNYVSQAKRAETCVLFDKEFQEKLANMEGEAVKKQGIMTLPSQDVLFLQAVDRLMKYVHICFLFSDLMAYKECFAMYPQLEYACEVIFLDDLNKQGYLEMANNYLSRVQIAEELIGEHQNLPNALVDIRIAVKDQLLKSFVPRGPNVVMQSTEERCLNWGAQEFVFADSKQLTENLFNGKIGGSFSVADPNFRQTLLNMPVERQTLNKHRFGMFMELFRFLYDFLAMHLTIRKTYLETFLNKCTQFIDFFSSVKSSKKRLHDDQNNHNLSLAMNRDKIREIIRVIAEKRENIKRKTADIKEIDEELSAVNEELDKVLRQKDIKLQKMIDGLAMADTSDFNHYVYKYGLADFPENETALIQTVGSILRPGQRLTKNDYDYIFLNRPDLTVMLERSRNKKYDDWDADTFNKLQNFIHKFAFGEFTRHLSQILYNILMELYRKLNIKNTMASIFQKVKELEGQKRTNDFSINYSNSSIAQKEKDLAVWKMRLSEQLNSGLSLSKKIEEAEISHMRTEQIFESVQKYARKIKSRLESVRSRTETILGDSMLFAASVVYMGPFSPKEKDQLRKSIINYLREQWLIQFNSAWLQPPTVTRQIKHKSMFTMALEDMGLRDFFNEDNLPHVLSKSDLTEVLFSLLFSTSCPAICDPTGQLMDFVQQRLLGNTDLKTISGADLASNEKVMNTLWNQRFALITDVNCLSKTGSGLSQDQSMLRRLCQFVHNGYDFFTERLKSIRELDIGNAFFSHFNQNRRMPTIDAGFEHLSLYQVMIFQSKFDFQLNDDYLQNATFLCASPSTVPLSGENSDQSQLVESKCKAVTTIKKCIIQNILPSSSGYQEIQENLKFVRSRISQLERNFENTFLVASEQTLKNMEDYAQLKQAVEDLIQGQEQRKAFSTQLKNLLTDTHVISHASRIIYLMYISLKIVSKVMHEVTYSWNQFVIVLNKVIFKVIKEHKEEVLADMRKSMNKKDLEATNLEDLEVEVDVNFFRKKLLPSIHQVVACNVKTDSSSFFNLVFSLQIAQSNGEIEEREMQYVLNQFVALKEFWSWRSSDSHFVSMTDKLEVNRLHQLKSELLQLYPDMSRAVFDHIANNLGNNFTYADASLYFQKQLRAKYNLKPFQLITYGFLCPDSEFKGRLVHFMYTVLQETFEFSENLPSFHTFLQAAEWKEQPITVVSSSSLNPVNLVTSIANFYKRKLLVLRADPVTEMARHQIQPFSQALTDKINSQLLDFSAVRQSGQGVNFDRLRGLSVNVISEPSPENVPLAKQHWNVLKHRQANLDEGSLLSTLSNGGQQLNESQQLDQILDCARTGSWVLVCPVQFPQYVGKLKERLRDIVDEISDDFRLIFDLQGTAQNEIPDSFLFDSSVTFQLSESNVDELGGFNDIWSRVLDQSCLNILQDVGISVGNYEERKVMAEATHAALRKIEGDSEDWGAKEIAAIKVFEEQLKDDPQQTDLFKQYVKQNADEFSAIYSAQRAETRARITEERRQMAERKAKILEEAKLLEKNSRFKSRPKNQSGTSLSNQSSNIVSNSDLARVQRDHVGSNLQISSAGNDDNRHSSADMVTETSKTERASKDGFMRAHITEEPSQENLPMIVDIASAEDEELRDSVSEIDIHAKIQPMEAPISNRGFDESDIIQPSIDKLDMTAGNGFQGSRSAEKIGEEKFDSKDKEEQE